MSRDLQGGENSWKDAIDLSVYSSGLRPAGCPKITPCPVCRSIAQKKVPAGMSYDQSARSLKYLLCHPPNWPKGQEGESFLSWQGEKVVLSAGICALVWKPAAECAWRQFLPASLRCSLCAAMGKRSYEVSRRLKHLNHIHPPHHRTYTTHNTPQATKNHEQPRRSLAQLRAEKEARLRTVQEGIRICEALGEIMEGHQKYGFADRSTVFEQLAVLLQSATQACILVEHGTFLDRANAYRLKGTVQERLGQTNEALATFREAQQLYKSAETHVDCDAWEVKQNSMVLLCTIGSLLRSINQYAAS